MDKWETWEPGGGGGKEAWVDRALECMWTTGSPPPKDTHVISQPGSSIAIHRAKGRSATCLRLLAAGSSQSPASLPHPEGRAVSPDPDRARTNLHNVHRRAHRPRSAPTAPTFAGLQCLRAQEIFRGDCQRSRTKSLGFRAACAAEVRSPAPAEIDLASHVSIRI